MSEEEDWQHDLIPRRISWTREARELYEQLKSQLNRGDEIITGLIGHLRDCAHKFPVVFEPVHIAQARIPGSTDRISCEFTFNDRAVKIHDIYVEPM